MTRRIQPDPRQIVLLIKPSIRRRRNNSLKGLVEDRGWVSDEALDRVRRAGYGDGEIVEILAIVAWKTFANYFNLVAGTDVDFPNGQDVIRSSGATALTTSKIVNSAVSFAKI